MAELDACRHFLAAASALGIEAEARAEVKIIAKQRPGTFRVILMQSSSSQIQRDAMSPYEPR